MAGSRAIDEDLHSGDSRGFTACIAVGLLAGWIVLGKAGPTCELAPGVPAWYPPAVVLAEVFRTPSGRNRWCLDRVTAVDTA